MLFRSPVKVGDYVEFDAEQTADGKYWNADAKSFRQLEKPGPSKATPVSAPSAAPARAPYVDRNDSIVYQSSRKDAIETVKLLQETGAIDFGKAKTNAQKVELVELYIDKYTVRYVEDTQRLAPPEHPSAEVKPKASKAVEPAGDAFVDDEITF